MERGLTFDDLPAPSVGFEPGAFYNRRGDVVHFHFKSDPAWMDRIDGFLTLYRSRETNEIVGFALKSIRSVVLVSLADLVRDLEAPDARVALRLRDLLGLVLSRHPPQKEHVEAYVMLLAQEFENALVPADALQPA